MTVSIAMSLLREKLSGIRNWMAGFAASAKNSSKTNIKNKCGFCNEYKVPYFWTLDFCGNCGHKLKEDNMSLSCERVTDRTAEEEQFLDERKRYMAGELGLAQSVDDRHKRLMGNNNGIKTEAGAIDNVNHPPHYNKSGAKCTCGRTIECIDVTRHMNFNIGNAIKYLWRCDLKGASVEDLRKAIWYIQDEINQRIKL